MDLQSSWVYFEKLNSQENSNRMKLAWFDKENLLETYKDILNDEVSKMLPLKNQATFKASEIRQKEKS